MEKKLFLILQLFFVILAASVLSENLYQYDSLKLKLDLRGEIELTAESPAYSIKEASAKLLLYPQDSYRQQLFEIDTQGGTAVSDKVTYRWENPTLGKKEFGYSATVRTNNQRTEIKKKIPFPLELELGEDQELAPYLLPTETIDSDNPKVIAQASSLAQGESDLFAVTSKLASWVEENIDYKLDSLTAKASKKASWVLDNREGVCDEMTTLFVAMCRTLGIPARSVSGMAYSNSPLFSEKWQPHGWAEVYFPERGWVSFDPTFGEYGYIDVTHLKLQDSTDPAEPSTKYQWLSNQVKLKSKDLDFGIELLDKGTIQKEEIFLEEKLLVKEVDFGSYSLIKGIVKNTADYYTAVTLNLALPPEVEISGRNRRTLWLAPEEIRETYWVVRISPGLNPHYRYEFPIVIYTEKNLSITDSLYSQKGKAHYSEPEIKQLAVTNEGKTYSQQVSLSCHSLKEVHLGEEALINCSLKNTGNTNLEQVHFCLGQSCEIIDLPINQIKNSQLKIKAYSAGWNKLIVSAENGVIEKKMAIEFAVTDTPGIEVQIEVPEKADYDKTFQMSFLLKKTSFATPKNLTLTVKGLGLESRWDLEELKNEEKIIQELGGNRLARNNRFKIDLAWKDAEGKSYHLEKEFTLDGKANSFWESIKMFFNGILFWFS